MKAWHVQDRDGRHQQIIFADKKHQAISQSEARSWVEYIEVRATRAVYADGLQEEPEKLLQAQLENGWWFECHGKCTNHIVKEDNYRFIDGSIYCGDCSEKLNSKVVRFKEQCVYCHTIYNYKDSNSLNKTVYCSLNCQKAHNRKEPLLEEE